MALTERPASRPSGVFFQPSRKRFQAPLILSDSVLRIDRTGTILSTTPSARSLLEYAPDQAVEPCFFSLVHSKNLYQVMRDVADMIVHGKRAAEWFFRLRTGRHRWQWYRAKAINQDSPDAEIVIELYQALS